MSSTPEELAEMARADAEIEREFILTAEEAAESRELDRAALMERKDKQAKAVAEYQRRYREANKEAVAERNRRYREANNVNASRPCRTHTPFPSATPRRIKCWATAGPWT